MDPVKVGIDFRHPLDLNFEKGDKFCMEYPLWLPKPEYSRKGLILALARCVFELHYKKEGHVTKGMVRTFDNMCSGDLEKVATVLHRAGFTRYLDDMGRRSEFVCSPHDFEYIAGSASVDSIEVASIEEAVTRLASGNYRSSLEIDKLAEEISGGA